MIENFRTFYDRTSGAASVTPAPDLLRQYEQQHMDWVAGVEAEKQARFRLYERELRKQRILRYVERWAFALAGLGLAGMLLAAWWRG